MNNVFGFKRVMCVTGLVLAGFGCASKEPALPPMKPVPLAGSPTEVLRALPGGWKIDVEASANAMARGQFQPHPTAVIRRASEAGTTRETSMITERFDPKAYREARRYWQELLGKPDMQWQLNFKPDGTGEHLAIIKTGEAPQNTPFTWRLDGWRLNVTYPEGSQFRSFEVEMPSAVELNYPMEPLGDHLVLRPSK